MRVRQCALCEHHVYFYQVYGVSFTTGLQVRLHFQADAPVLLLVAGWFLLQLQVSRAGLEGTIEYCAPEVLRGEP